MHQLHVFEFPENHFTNTHHMLTTLLKAEAMEKREKMNKNSKCNNICNDIDIVTIIKVFVMKMIMTPE